MKVRSTTRASKNSPSGSASARDTLLRLFKKHVASPTQVAQTARVQRAKRMIDNTNLADDRDCPRRGFWQLAAFQYGICRCLQAPTDRAPARKAPSCAAGPACANVFPRQRGVGSTCAEPR
jgi:hypothetical protein